MNDETSKNNLPVSETPRRRVRRRKPVDASRRAATPPPLQLLFVVVDRRKADFYEDLLTDFEINLHMALNAKGTASVETLRLLGLTDTDKAVLISVIRADRAAEALRLLEEKFRTVRGGKGIAYTVSMTSVIGVAVYQFLSNMTQS